MASKVKRINDSGRVRREFEPPVNDDILIPCPESGGCADRSLKYLLANGVTPQVLAKIDAVRCARNTDPKGCASGLTPMDVEVLIHQAAWDWEQNVYSCRTTPVSDAATLKRDTKIECDLRKHFLGITGTPPRTENIIDLGEGKI